MALLKALGLVLARKSHRFTFRGSLASDTKGKRGYKLDSHRVSQIRH